MTEVSQQSIKSRKLRTAGTSGGLKDQGVQRVIEHGIQVLAGVENT